MLSEDDMVKTVDGIYVARVAGDMSALSACLAAGSSYTMNGGTSMLKSVPTGPEDAEAAVAKLIGMYRFHSAERGETIVSGNKAAIIMKVKVSAGDGPAVKTEFLDLWEFDDDAKVTSLRQFIDTALAASLIA